MCWPIAIRAPLVCAVVVAAMAALTVSSPPAQRRASEDGPASGGGFGTAVAWSAAAGCFGPDSTEPAAVCLKTRALTALDRAIATAAVDIVDGVTLATRVDGPPAGPSSEKADRAALDAVADPGRKNALLDRMIADRMYTLVTTKTVVLDGSVGQEGECQRLAVNGFVSVSDSASGDPSPGIRFEIISIFQRHSLNGAKFYIFFFFVDFSDKSTQFSPEHVRESSTFYSGFTINALKPQL